MNNILHEYGLASASEWRHWFKMTAPRGSKIKDHGHYVAVVRRILRQQYWQAPFSLEDSREGKLVDGRLLAVGFNKMSPNEFVSQIDDWLKYWSEAAPRCSIVGSSHNPSTESAWVAYRRKWPPSTAAVIAMFPDFTSRNSTSTRRKAEFIGVAIRRSIDDTRGMKRGNCSPKLLVLLGKLCPELMLVALDTLPVEYPNRQWKPQDVSWDVVAKYQRLLVNDPTGKLRIALAMKLRGERRGNVPQRVRWLIDRRVQRWELVNLCPVYPNVDTHTAACLALGESPQSIAKEQGATLTKAEAHRWMMDGAPPLVRWCLPRELSAIPVRRVPVALWLAKQWARPAGRQALTRLRSARGPGGAQVEFRYLNKVDELMEQDLCPSVENTFRRAAERFTAEYLAEQKKQTTPICKDIFGVRSSRVKVLLTPKDLVSEGEEQKHCVGGYHLEVAAGNCWILSINAWGQRSTAEITIRSRNPAERHLLTPGTAIIVLQHLGSSNSKPPEVCCRVLASWLRRACK